MQVYYEAQRKRLEGEYCDWLIDSAHLKEKPKEKSCSSSSKNNIIKPPIRSFSALEIDWDPRVCIRSARDINQYFFDINCDYCFWLLFFCCLFGSVTYFREFLFLSMNKKTIFILVVLLWIFFEHFEINSFFLYSNDHLYNMITSQ